MYEAVLEGDWLAMEKLLERSPSIALDEITQRGDRALHLAASMGRVDILRALVERVSSSDLTLLDGRGYTACCYSALLGDVEIVDLMMKKNANCVTARDKDTATPLHKAALCGNKKMVLYFLESPKVKDFSREEWFDILLLVMQTKMYGMIISFHLHYSCLMPMEILSIEFYV